MTLLVNSVIWLLVPPFLYGYHISALNQIQAVLTCKYDGPAQTPMTSPLPTCIPMNDFAFSLVTAIFTIGGLIGSLFANRVMDSRGRVGASRLSTLLIAMGGAILGVSGSVTSFAIGRLIIGVGSGVGLCVAPVFLAEISPPRFKSRLGVLTQLSVVVGLFITQLIGMHLANPIAWRLVFHFSSVVALIQLMLSVFLVDSPAWLRSQGQNDLADSVALSLWGPDHTKRLSGPDPETQAPLLTNLDDQESPRPRIAPPLTSITQLLTVPDLRRPLIIVSLAMFSQQFSGVNAVLYYSNDILSKTLPEFGPHISLAITVVNVIMTFPAIFLIEHTGRRRLLQISAIGAVISLFCVGIGLNTNSVTLSSAAILAFIMSFAVGLGPVPFVLIPEVSPFHAVSAVSSITLALNWLSNFTVGLTFLPLRNVLSGGNPHKEGRVFYVFAALLSIGVLSLNRFYRA